MADDDDAGARKLLGQVLQGIDSALGDTGFRLRREEPVGDAQSLELGTCLEPFGVAIVAFDDGRQSVGDIEVQPGRDGIRGIGRTRQGGGNNKVPVTVVVVKISEGRNGIGGLRATNLVQGDISGALNAKLGVPIRLTMTDEGESSCRRHCPHSLAL